MNTWTAAAESLEFADAWQPDEPGARWRSAPGHGPSAGARQSGGSVIEVEPGCRLPRHTDSAEEVVVVLAGGAEVAVEDESATLGPGGMALVPPEAPHEVRNAGQGTLRFLAFYGAADVVTRYARPVEPGGERERSPVS